MEEQRPHKSLVVGSLPTGGTIFYRYKNSNMIYLKNNIELENEPICSNEDEHDWRTPHHLVGGIKENPGVWSLGGTKMSFEECCSNCGVYKQELHYGSQRNPDEEDTATYSDADEASLAWIEENKQDE